MRKRRTRTGAELDCCWLDGGHQDDVEVKYGDAPGMTPSMLTACTDLKLRRLLVLYPDEHTYELTSKISVMPLSRALQELS